MKLTYLTLSAVVLALAGCAGDIVVEEEEAVCDDAVLQSAQLPAETPEVVGDDNCGLGNDPGKIDPDNPGQGHNK